MNSASKYEALKASMIKFRDEREWRQFHTVQGLITSVSIEAAELLELTQWKTSAQIDAKTKDPDYLQAIKEEAADVFLYIMFLADTLGFDLLDAAQDKMIKNNEKYPVEKARGTATKYSRL